MGRFLCFTLVLTWLVGASAFAQTIRYGMVELPRADGNPFTMVGPSGTMVWSGLFDALTVMEADGSLQPAMAMAWSQEDALTWRFIPGMAAYNEHVTPYPYDPARARVLLSEAGYPNGFPFAINVVVGGFIPANTAENDGDKLIHGSGGNVPAAGGAKVCHL